MFLLYELIIQLCAFASLREKKSRRNQIEFGRIIFDRYTVVKECTQKRYERKGKGVSLINMEIILIHLNLIFLDQFLILIMTGVIIH